jgi:hypothetical protein
MSAIRILWLILAIAGAIVPWLYFGPWLWENSFDLGAMVDLWTANDAVTGVTYDVSWAYLVLVIWVLVESLPRKDWKSLLAIPAGVMVGVSFALPLYLFLRSRPGVAR